MIDRTLICVSDSFEGFLSCLAAIKHFDLVDYTIVKYKNNTIKYLDNRLITIHSRIFILNLEIDQSLCKFIDKDKFEIYTCDYLVYNFKRACIKRDNNPFFILHAINADIKTFYLDKKIVPSIFNLFFIFMSIRDKEYKLFFEIIQNKIVFDKIIEASRAKFEKIYKVIDIYEFDFSVLTKDRFDEFYYICLMNKHKKESMFFYDVDKNQINVYSNLKVIDTLLGKSYKHNGYKKIFDLDKKICEYILNFKKQ